MNLENTQPNKVSPSLRMRVWYGFVLVVMSLFIIRLFYLQVIKHEYYSSAALNSQLKEYEIPPKRGSILVKNGSAPLPLVLNETLYTLFADPKFIENAPEAAIKVQEIIGGDASYYSEQMNQDSRYVVLAKKLSKEQKQKLERLELKGLGLREVPYRTYPQGSLAAQLLGFVNDEGKGKYGIEEYLNEKLAGKPGQLKAITDASGVPLLSDPENVNIQAQDGQSVMLTIDLSMQRQLEELLKNGLKRARAKSGGAFVIDPSSGAIKAMANYPSYNPSKFFDVKDQTVFNNALVSSPLEVGSVMKTLTAAAALNQGVVSTKTSYYDPAQFTIDSYTIKNIEEDGGAGTRSLADILQLSLNTGATWLLMQMGGGEINERARKTWHNYMVNHYRFGKITGIEQGYEAPGTIPDPIKGFGLNLQYANTAFGQGMTATPLQLGSALSAVINGGTYYKPTLIDTVIAGGKEQKQKPQIAGQNVVKPEVSKTLVDLMRYVIEKNHFSYGMPQLPPSSFIVGGKTGTAEIARPTGGYYEDKFNGTFVGFVGGNKPQYVVIVRVDEPNIAGYAGSGAAAPIFSDLVNMLINNSFVSPK